MSGRVYHHYRDMEEYAGDSGMWRVVSGSVLREQYADAAMRLMARPEAFKAAMRRALREWPNSCEVAFTADGNNQRAWLGHAGCFLATGSPEECTRLGWHKLNDQQQYAANAAADEIIAEWRSRRVTVTGQLDLFGGDDDA